MEADACVFWGMFFKFEVIFSVFGSLGVGIGRGSTAKKGISYLKETIYKIELRIKTKC